MMRSLPMNHFTCLGILKERQSDIPASGGMVISRYVLDIPELGNDSFMPVYVSVPRSSREPFPEPAPGQWVRAEGTLYLNAESQGKDGPAAAAVIYGARISLPVPNPDRNLLSRIKK